MAQELTIGQCLKRIRRPVTIEDDVEYQLVTIKLKHGGVVERSRKVGKDIGTKKMYRVNSGDFILSGIDARNGAFGIVPDELDGAVVTNDFWYFDVNEEIISTDLFLALTQTNWFDHICRLGSDGTTQRIRLQKDKFFNQTITLPSIEKQPKILKRLQRFKDSDAVLTAELEKQKKMLAKYRQAILQEAIEGKLTADWREENPDIEPAAELLERITDKRAKWIAVSKEKGYKEASTIDKKIKKLQKTILTKPKIKLPQKWEWAPIIAAVQLIVDCHNKTAPYVDSGIPLIRTTNIRNGVLDLSTTKFVTEETYCFWSKRCFPEPGDIVFTREAPVGEGAIIPDGVKLCLGQRTMLIRTYEELVQSKYLLYLITSPDFLTRISKERKGAMVGHLRVGDVENFQIPLPPFAEQQEIVRRIEVKFALCDQLEAQINASAHTAETLSAAILQELFGQNGGEA